MNSNQNLRGGKSRFMLPILLLAVLLGSCKPGSSEEEEKAERPEYMLVIHGGAGTIQRSEMTPIMDQAYRAALNSALDAGETILKEGGSALDAVEAAIRVLEDDSLFNAGRGAVFNHDGVHELDAAIMDGTDLSAGAAAGTRHAKNPISLARAVMERSEHVLLTGQGADDFALLIGLDTVPQSYFSTERRRRNLEKAQAVEKDSSLSMLTPGTLALRYGTVGAVALDKKGNLAAGTSTGGMTNKRWNRVGDAPLIGSGTYADNRSCAVSCTGHGEYFIRFTVAHDVAARVRYLGERPSQAAAHILDKELGPKGGTGGLIALDAQGNFTMPFNTEGMYRGYTKPGKRVVAIYADE